MLLHVTGLCCKQNYYLYSSLNVEVCKLFLSNWKRLCWLILMLTNVICHVSTNIPGGSKLISIRESLNLVTSTWKLDELMAFCGEDNKNNCNQNEINVLLILVINQPHQVVSPLPFHCNCIFINQNYQIINKSKWHYRNGLWNK